MNYGAAELRDPRTEMLDRDNILFAIHIFIPCNPCVSVVLSVIVVIGEARDILLRV